MRQNEEGSVQTKIMLVSERQSLDETLLKSLISTPGLTVYPSVQRDRFARHHGRVPSAGSGVPLKHDTKACFETRKPLSGFRQAPVA